MKTCFKCGLTKSQEEFYRHPEMADGRLGKCKECAKRDVSANYRLRHDQYREYERARFQSPQRREYVKEQARLHRERHPEKAVARNAVNNAVRDGRMTRMPCEECGDARSQAHHTDYSRPLDVRWLCFVCHRREHGQLQEIIHHSEADT